MFQSHRNYIKIIAVGIVFFFLGTNIFPAIGGVSKNATYDILNEGSIAQYSRDSNEFLSTVEPYQDSESDTQI
jgi:hypothetical protein